ncbi:MAG: TIR domain-containing protein [Xanthobacteraceae bacterium]
MSRLFLSRSSENKAEALALRDWLNCEGWDDVFLDADPELGMAAGEHWERALKQAAHRCEAVLFVVSRGWLSSDQCLKEFNLAHRLNKRLFGVFIEDIATTELTSNLAGTWQIVRLGSPHDSVTLPVAGTEVQVTFSAEGLLQLKNALQRARLDPRFFAWPPQDNPNRPPYRGLRPLEAEDAGIFFGREEPVTEALDRLRGLRHATPPRFLVVLGESGVGKSSFLRAGLLPRLARDERNFLPLPVVRPQEAAILGRTGLVHSLETALGARKIAYPRADIRAAIDGGAPALLPLLAKLVSAPDSGATEPEAKPPVLVLPIDQGEELFFGEGHAEAERLLALVRGLLLAEAPGIIVLVTMRSDGYERLRTAKALEGIRQETLSLVPMPRAAYPAVIEGPANRLKDRPRALTIEPELIQALLADIQSIDGPEALPLLAFTLERLYLQYRGSQRRTLADYNALGPIGGLIEAAADRSLALAKPKAPRERAAQLVLLRRSLIPWLADVDPETQRPRRRVARLSEIPSDARRLIRRLIEHGLLTTGVEHDSGGVTIELAHETLLRQWGLLRGWLNEDGGRLLTRKDVNRSAFYRATISRKRPSLTYWGSRLGAAERLKDGGDLAFQFAPVAPDYLAQGHRENAGIAENIQPLRERNNRWHIRLALIGVFVAVIAALGGSFW